MSSASFSNHSTSNFNTLESVQAANWNGCIPVLLTLASTSLSSPTLPPPIHILLSRHTYLHVGLSDAIERLHKFAPTTLSFTSGIVQNEPDPGSYGGVDDQHVEPQSERGTAALAATSAINTRNYHSNSNMSLDWSSCYPVCWFEDEGTQIALRWHIFVGVLYDIIKCDHLGLPWKLRLHFTSYPISQILPLESGQVLLQLHQAYKNSLKQALCLQHGNSRAAMNLTKDAHGRLWEAVSTSNFQLYHQVHVNNMPKQSTDDMVMIPVRVYVNAQPPLQRSCRHVETATLGLLMAEWMPEHFEKVRLTNEEENSSTIESIRPVETGTKWIISGLCCLPLESSLLQLWRQLSHADHFLYIVVTTVKIF